MSDRRCAGHTWVGVGVGVFQFTLALCALAGITFMPASRPAWTVISVVNGACAGAWLLSFRLRCGYVLGQPPHRHQRRVR